MDRIALHGLELWAHHGVGTDEQERGQPFVVHVTIELDLAPAAASDDLPDTVDYATLSQVIVDAAREPRADLLETVAERVAGEVLDHDRRVTEVEVTIDKPHAPLPVAAAGVSVSVRRSR
ncbi:MAG: dihydroneopterin aldolase [Actinobacteria bacterium]|nr:dihydroneopterin aldolase [Actinomycetota bacterium]